MPSTQQSGNGTNEYDSPADRVCAEWDNKALRRLYPTGEALAREYLGANTVGRPVYECVACEDTQVGPFV